MLMGLAISPKALIPGMVGISGIIFLVVADQAFMDSRKYDFEVSMALSTLSCAAMLRSIRFASTGGSLPSSWGWGWYRVGRATSCGGRSCQHVGAGGVTEREVVVAAETLGGRHQPAGPTLHP